MLSRSWLLLQEGGSVCVCAWKGGVQGLVFSQLYRFGFYLIQGLGFN